MTELAHEIEMTRPRSPMRDAWQRFLRNKLALAGLIIVGILVVTAIGAPVLAPRDPATAVLSDKRAEPSREYLLGADELGRDILSRLIYGSRVALMVAVLAVGIATVIGGAIGLVSGFLGGWVDEVLMRLMDILLAFPYLLLAIAVVAALGTGVWKTTIAVAIWAVPNFARVIRGQVLTIKERDYVLAAEALGARTTRQLLSTSRRTRSRRSSSSPRSTWRTRSCWKRRSRSSAWVCNRRTPAGG